jgi:hypothetical protein
MSGRGSSPEDWVGCRSVLVCPQRAEDNTSTLRDSVEFGVLALRVNNRPNSDLE